MKIKEGFNSKPLKLQISAHADSRLAEVWIDFESKHPQRETLSYATLEELLNLKDEIDKAITCICKLEEKNGN